MNEAAILEKARQLGAIRTHYLEPPSGVRGFTRGYVIRWLLEKRPAAFSQRQVAQQTGASVPTVCNAVNELLARGMLDTSMGGKMGNQFIYRWRG